MINQVRASLSSLSKSERAVAETILADPEHSVHLSIARLATAAGVSEPTVNRFCRSLGCRGFPDFKLRLAQLWQIQPTSKFVVWMTVIRPCNWLIKCLKRPCRESIAREHVSLSRISSV